jgi:hypothetical protein
MAFTSVQALMQQILSLQQIGRVAGETASSIDTTSISAIVQRAFQSGVLLNGTDSSRTVVSVPSLQFSSNSSYDVSVVSYKNISQCLADRRNVPNSEITIGECGEEILNTLNSKPVSDITTAEIVDSNGTVHDISNLPTSQVRAYDTFAPVEPYLIPTPPIAYPCLRLS